MRIDMESNKAGLEYLMSLVDEAERIITADPLAEDHEVLAYSLESPVAVSRSDFHRSAASCHDCDGYMSRTVFPRPMMLEGSRIADFRKWWHDSLLLQEGEWSLTSIIKCPVQVFSDAAADACRGYLKEEMEEYAPEALVILGADAARYMLRRDGSIDKFLKRRFMINHIPAFVSPSLEEYAANPSLRCAIWENFLFIRSTLSLDKRQP